MSGAAPEARIALLGTGAVAQVAHLPILTRTAGARVVALYDADPAKGASVARRFGVPRVARSPDELWQDDQIDAVVICTPSNLHSQHARDGLQAGKYVLCERPLGVCAAEAAAVLQHPAAAGRLVVAMNHRFRADAAALHAAVQAGDLGEVFSVDAGWLNRRTPQADQTWRQSKGAAGGGALMDLGLPYLDLLLWVLDYPEPERVLALTRRSPGAEVESFASLTLRLVGGRTVRLQVAWNAAVAEDLQYLDLLGTDGSASLAPLQVYARHAQGGTSRVPRLPPGPENPYTASYRRELEHFVALVRRGASAALPQEQATLMRIMDAAYQSADQRREIWLVEPPAR